MANFFAFGNLLKCKIVSAIRPLNPGVESYLGNFWGIREKEGEKRGRKRNLIMRKAVIYYHSPCMHLANWYRACKRTATWCIGKVNNLRKLTYKALTLVLFFVFFIYLLSAHDQKWPSSLLNLHKIICAQKLLSIRRNRVFNPGDTQSVRRRVYKQCSLHKLHSLIHSPVLFTFKHLAKKWI